MTPLTSNADHYLYICNRRWTVTYVSVAMDEDDNATYGTTDQATQTIQISTKYNGDVRRATLLHEVLHAAINTSIGAHPNGEERCVRALETALYSILRDERNQWLLATLLDGLYTISNANDKEKPPTTKAKAERPKPVRKTPRRAAS